MRAWPPAEARCTLTARCIGALHWATPLEVKSAAYTAAHPGLKPGRARCGPPHTHTIRRAFTGAVEQSSDAGRGWRVADQIGETQNPS